MAEIIFEKPEDIGNVVCSGDFFIVDDDLFIIAQIDYEDFRIISLQDGQRWNEENVHGMEISDIIENFMGCPTPNNVKYIPTNSAKINFECTRKK